jgi:hypothetical protein
MRLFTGAARDWQLGWSHFTDMPMGVRDAATGHVLYELPVLGVVHDVDADPDRDTACAIVEESLHDTSSLRVIAWDVAASRIRWRLELGVNRGKERLDYYRVAIVGDVCTIAGAAGARAFALADGSDVAEVPPIPATNFAAGAVPEIERPPYPYGFGIAITEGTIWYFGRGRLSAQSLRTMALPSEVEGAPAGFNDCGEASPRTLYCWTREPLRLYLRGDDGVFVDTEAKLPKSYRQWIDAVAVSDAGLAVRRGTAVVVGTSGPDLRRVDLPLDDLGHRTLAWTDAGLIVADGVHGVALVDVRGKVRWRTELTVVSSGVIPGGLVFVEAYPRTLVVLDAVTGDERGRAALPGPLDNDLAFIDGELRGKTPHASVRVALDAAGSPTVTYHARREGLPPDTRTTANSGFLIADDYSSVVTIVEPDGTPRVKSAFYEAGAYVLAADGTFDCRGNGCDALRCTTTDGTSHPVDHSACADLRRTSWDL